MLYFGQDFPYHWINIKPQLSNKVRIAPVAHQHHVPVPKGTEDLQKEHGPTDVRYPELGSERGQVHFESEHAVLGRGEVVLVLAFHGRHGAEGLAGLLDELVADAEDVGPGAAQAVGDDDEG